MLFNIPLLLFEWESIRFLGHQNFFPWERKILLRVQQTSFQFSSVPLTPSNCSYFFLLNQCHCSLVAQFFYFLWLSPSLPPSPSSSSAVNWEGTVLLGPYLSPVQNPTQAAVDFSTSPLHKTTSHKRVLAGLVQIFLVTGNTACLSFILMHTDKTSTNRPTKKNGSEKEKMCVVLIENQIEVLIRSSMEV